MPAAPHESGLPVTTTHITTHDQTTGKSIIHSSKPVTWYAFDPSTPTFNVAIHYTTQETPADLNNDKDIKAHEELYTAGKATGVTPRGSNLRMLDVAPGYTSSMHRTVSLDYGILLEGTLELVSDAGEHETRVMTRGDVSIMRGTMHAWRNPSKTEWARVCFVVLDIEKVKLGDKELEEVWN